MLAYLAKKYFAVAAVLALAFIALPLILGVMSLMEVVPAAVLLSGLVTPLVIYREFHRRKLWPLYDNLRRSRIGLLALLSGLQIIVYIALRWWVSLTIGV